MKAPIEIIAWRQNTFTINSSTKSSLNCMQFNEEETINTVMMPIRTDMNATKSEKSQAPKIIVHIPHKEIIPSVAHRRRYVY